MFEDHAGAFPKLTAESRLPVGFFAYASLPPSIPETIAAAIQAITNRSII